MGVKRTWSDLLAEIDQSADLRPVAHWMTAFGDVDEILHAAQRAATPAQRRVLHDVVGNLRLTQAIPLLLVALTEDDPFNALSAVGKIAAYPGATATSSQREAIAQALRNLIDSTSDPAVRSSAASSLAVCERPGDANDVASFALVVPPVASYPRAPMPEIVTQLVGAMADAWPDHGSILSAQIESAIVMYSDPEAISWAVPDGVPLLPLADGPVPWRLDGVAVQQDPAGQLLLWVEAGRTTCLELLALMP